MFSSFSSRPFLLFSETEGETVFNGFALNMQSVRRSERRVPWGCRCAPVDLACTPVTLLRGDVPQRSAEGEPLPCLLSCSKVCYVASNTSKHISRNTDIGNAAGSGPYTHTHTKQTDVHTQIIHRDRTRHRPPPPHLKPPPPNTPNNPPPPTTLTNKHTPTTHILQSSNKTPPLYS